MRGNVVCEVFVDFLSIFGVYFLDCSLFWIRSVRVVWGVQLSRGHVIFFLYKSFLLRCVCRHIIMYLHPSTGSSSDVGQ